MIRGLVDFALNNRWLVLGLAIMLFAWGIVSFHNLPVEAYPDVANNYVQIITQWPGRAAEEVEQQVTIPLEIQMAGIPHMTHLRSTSLAGLSSLTLIFDDESVNDWNREKVVERLTQVTLPAGLQPQIGTDWSPVGQIFWYTVRSTNPLYDNMDLKSLEDWTIEKQFKSVPGVVDVSSFGGITREYQVRLSNSLPQTTPTPAAVSSSRASNKSMSARSASTETSRTSRTPRSRPNPAFPCASKTSLR
jgi:cobalt-zinc-cadmium resistance protein CzcA